MASFRKRGELQWQARINRKGFPAQVKTFSTRAQAEAWARQVESEIDRGVFVSRVEAEATSLSEALERYEREISAFKKGAVQERSVIVVWKGTDLARRSLAAVRSADVAKLRDEWLKTHKSATVLRRLAVLSHVFTIARKEWGMEGLLNPVELIRKPQVSNARTRRISTQAPSPAAPAPSAAWGMRSKGFWPLQGQTFCRRSFAWLLRQLCAAARLCRYAGSTSTSSGGWLTCPVPKMAIRVMFRSHPRPLRRWSLFVGIRVLR